MIHTKHDLREALRKLAMGRQDSVDDLVEMLMPEPAPEVSALPVLQWPQVDAKPAAEAAPDIAEMVIDVPALAAPAPQPSQAEPSARKKA